MIMALFIAFIFTKIKNIFCNAYICTYNTDSMTKISSFFRSALLALSLTAMALACNRPDPHSDNAFRNKMASLDWGDGVCHVYGHKTPDSDAVCSSLAYAGLMRELGYDCEAYVSSKTNNETNFISSYFGFALPEIKSSVTAGTRLIVTDHEEYSQSVAGADKGIVLQIIDHHQAGDMVGPDTFVYRKTVGSTCTLVWELYEAADVAVSDEMARILLAGILSDTSDLTKNTVTEEDSRAWFSLTEQLGIGPEDAEEIFRLMAEALSDYTGMSDSEIYLSDYKDYEIAGIPLGIGCVEWRDFTTMETFMDRMLAVMPQVMAEQRGQMAFCLATRYEPNPDPDSPDKAVADGTYLLYCGDGARETAEAICGPSLRDGICYSATRLGRKSGLVPALMEILGGQQ